MTASLRSIHRDSSAASQESRPCRILAVDYGRKRIGLAISDELQITAQPLLVMKRANRRDDLRRLRDICRKEGVARILVGHPLHITGEASEMAEEAARFAARVRKELGIEVDLVDERLTSWEAAQMVAESGSRRLTTSQPPSSCASIWNVTVAACNLQRRGRNNPRCDGSACWLFW
jgi:putative Holliday junction resolvase